MAIKFEGPMPESVIPFTSTREKSHTAGFRGISIDVYKLIHAAENLPISEVPLTDHLSELEGDCWTDEKGNRISPQEVIDIYKESGYRVEKAAERYPSLTKHLYCIVEADLSHPVLIYQDQIIDGMHRFCKAVIQEDPTIKARVLDFIPPGVEIQPGDFDKPKAE